MQQAKTCCHPRRRACIKIAIVVIAVLLALAGLIEFVDDQSVDELKHNFSLWTIIALVMIINLVSFLCFIMLYLAYRWIRVDLKPGKDELLDE